MEQTITRLFSLGETFANLWFVWFGSDRRACEASLRQCLLGIQRYILFDRPPRQLLGRMAPASSARDSASALRDGGPSQLREVLCMSSRRSSSSPSSSQQWAEVTSSLNGVCSRDSTFQPPALGTDGFVATLTGSGCQRYADGASSGPAHRFTITRSWRHRTRRRARRPGEVLREAHSSSIPKQHRRTTGRLWHISCRRQRRLFRLPARSLAGTRLGSTRMTQLALLQSAPSNIICSRSACCLRLLHANAPSRCRHPRGHCRPVYPRACSSG